MDIYKATITLFRNLPAATSVHDRYFMQPDHAVQTFKAILSDQDGVGLTNRRAMASDFYDAHKNGVKIAELRVLKIPVYDTARANLNF